MSRFVATVTLIWLLAVVAFAAWNIQSSINYEENIAIMTSRGFFDQIVLTRYWNTTHGGVYVPVTEKTSPNPYLDTPQREIVVDESLTLTKINPAYMTRQISEIVSEHKGIQFHITSLNPIRPQNRATEMEKKALESFETGESEYYRFTGDREERSFFYMAPLTTDKSCLQCHALQGYEEGDIRGGISISSPFPETNRIPHIILMVILIGLTGFYIIFWSSRKLRDAYALIEDHALKDHLTGIPNRRYFNDYLQKEFFMSKREKTFISLIMIDVDYFKNFNDSNGHLAGDHYLKALAEIISSSVRRPCDIGARFGGEEFSVILPQTDSEGAYIVAEGIRKKVEELNVSYKGKNLKTTISAGIATSSGTGNAIDSVNSLIALADEALYNAKDSGRNKVCIIPPQENLSDS